MPISTFYDPKQSMRDCTRTIERAGELRSFEGRARINQISESIKKSNIYNLVKPKDFGIEPIARVHSKKYIEFLKSASSLIETSMPGMEYAPDTFPVTGNKTTISDGFFAQLGKFALGSGTAIDEGTWTSAYASAQSAISAADWSITFSKPSLALCRPAGHHASKEKFGGLCFLNNAAIATEFALHEQCKRVAIVDIDVHHGNGTQDIFYDRSEVLYASIHIDPEACFPFYSGYSSEKGDGKGRGYNINAPLHKGAKIEDWLATFDAIADRIALFAPDLIVISLGLDTHADDPVGHFQLESKDFSAIGKALSNLEPDAPKVFVLEGGYNIEATIESMNRIFEQVNLSI